MPKLYLRSYVCMTCYSWDAGMWCDVVPSLQEDGPSRHRLQSIAGSKLSDCSHSRSDNQHLGNGSCRASNMIKTTLALSLSTGAHTECTTRSAEYERFMCAPDSYEIEPHLDMPPSTSREFLHLDKAGSADSPLAITRLSCVSLSCIVRRSRCGRSSSSVTSEEAVHQPGNAVQPCS